jgi:hypothetical protein
MKQFLVFIKIAVSEEIRLLTVTIYRICLIRVLYVCVKKENENKRLW